MPGGYSSGYSSGYDIGALAPGERPRIEDVAPVAGSTIARTATVYRSVVDPDGPEVTTVLWAKFPGGPWELIFDGAEFGPDYGFSRRIPITNGYRYEIRRTSGWLDSFVLGSVDVDPTGLQPL